MAERLAASPPAARADMSAGHERTLDLSASIASRILAYILDSAILFAVAMIFATIGFLNIFLRSDFGEENASDAATWSTAALLLLTVPAWALASLALFLRRGQSIGQYLLGLRVRREDGSTATGGRLAFYLLALHPLLYHPLIAGLWAFFAAVSLSFWATEAVFLAAVSLTILSLVAPLAALVSGLASRERRALHDRLADMKVVRIAE